MEVGKQSAVSFPVGPAMVGHALFLVRAPRKIAAGVLQYSKFNTAIILAKTTLWNID